MEVMMYELIKWVLDFAPFPIPQVVSWVIWGVQVLWAVAKMLFAFPFLDPGFHMVVTLPLWGIWIYLGTQPKPVDHLMDDVALPQVKKAADLVKGFTFSRAHPILTILACLTAQPLVAFGIIFSNVKFARFCITYGLANLMVSRKVMTYSLAEALGQKKGANFFLSLPVGWIISLTLGIVLVIVFYLFFTTDEYKREVDQVLVTHQKKIGPHVGFVTGWIFQIFLADFWPKSEKWTCPYCGHRKRNKIHKEKGPSQRCGNPDCKRPNPYASWKCKADLEGEPCGHDNPPNTDFCEFCGADNPRFVKLYEFREDGGVVDTPDHPLTPVTTEVTCRHCNQATPKGKYCQSCGREQQGALSPLKI